MSYSSLPLTSKLFQLTSLTCALALAGCGGGDGTDVIAPTPDLGVQPGTGGNNGGGNNNGGGEQTPEIEPDFFIQKLSTAPTIIELSDDQAAFSVTVKAVEKVSGGAMVGKAVTLKVVDSENNGITIEGQSTQTTDSDGNAVYTLKLNPQAVADKADLIANGFTLVANANRANGSAVAPQELKVSVRKEGTGGGAEVITSELDIQSMLTTTSVSNNTLNPFGDTAQFVVTAKDTNGARAEGVKVGLGIANIAGISILDGNSKTTNSNGVATFTIKIDENLTEAQRNVLLKNVAYEINILEQNGATKTVVSEFVVATPISDYKLKVTNNTRVLSAYGDTQNLTISATPTNQKVTTNIAGANVGIELNNAPVGVSLASNKLVLDDKGQASVALVIAAGLEDAVRKTLAKDGISYTITLSEPNRSVTIDTFKTGVEVPTAKNIVSFEQSDKKQISSSGGSAVVSFRVNSEDGGAVAGQKVKASLPTKLSQNGLLTIDGSAEQTTNDRGIVSYTVRVPAGLNADQKLELEKAGGFALNVKALEASGASTEANSERIAIGKDIGQSDIQLTSRSTPATVVITDSQFNIQVSGKRTNGSAATNKVVKLDLSNVLGVSIQGGNQQTTDQNGNALFTINVNQDLTPSQRDALVKSGIKYTAILTDDDGTQADTVNTINVVKPATSINFASILTPTISELGGNGSITVKLLSKDNQTPVKGQVVAIQLGQAAIANGITVNQTNSTTDFSGETTFIVTIPQGLSAAKREELKRSNINYQLSYVEKGITYNSDIKQVNIVTPAIDLEVLNAPNTINNRAEYVLDSAGETVNIQAQMTNQANGLQVASQPVKLKFDNPQLASLLTVNGQIGSSTITANTDANGIVSFDVVVPNTLTKAQKDLLDQQALTATVTETLTGKTQAVKVKVQSSAPNVSLSAVSSAVLNLNGGQTQIVVVAEDDNGTIVTGQKVFLSLPASIASQGVTLVSGSSQTTDNSGKATFTIAVPNNLTVEQKNSFTDRGSKFTVALSAADSRGNIATQTTVVNTVTPTGTQENITIGANKVVNTKGDTFKVFVRVENKKGSIANREVRLNVDNPIKTGVTVSSNTAMTNGDGLATFDLTLTDGANVNQAILEAGIKLTATTTTAEGVELPQTYIVAVDTATIDSYQLIASSDKSTLNTGGDQTNATFRVTDSKGGILAGVPVQLSIEDLEASGAALTTPSMVTTDANGQIDVGVILAANSINSRLNHSVVINAKIVTPQYDADGKVSMQVREEKSLSLSAIGTEITIAATEANLKDGASTTITTTLVDGAGRAIANAGMELVDANGDVIHSSATAISNADGQAVFNINEADLTFDSNGNLRVFARALGENSINTQRSLTSIELIKVSQAGISFIDIKDVYDVNKAQTINIQIRRDTAAQAAELIGKQVEVQTTLGKFANGSAASNNVIVTKTIAATDISGNVITIPVTLTSELAGITALQATVLGETQPNGEPRYRATVDARFRATTPAKMLFQAVKSVITPGGSTEIVATVKDKNDVPVEGQTVVFSRASDSSAGRLSAATAITDSKGEARVVYKANASSPIGGVKINARLLDETFGRFEASTNITVSKEAVYTTLAFSNVVSSDTIYYTKRVSISVMDGSGRAVPNKEVSIKSYATQYAQGRYCLLDSTVTYQAADEQELDDKGNVIKTTTPMAITKSEKVAVSLPQNFGWISTEDSNYNYTLDKDSDPILNEDKNGNNSLEAINPVAIIGGTLSDDGYTFVTDAEGRADFEIRYPLRYSNWVKVRFDASTFVNGTENTQSINYQLPSAESDLSITGSSLTTPWIDNMSPFGAGGATCVNSMSVNINDQKNTTKVTLSPYKPGQTPYFVSINGVSSNTTSTGYETYIVDFNQAFVLGSTVTVTRNGFDFSQVLKAE